MTDEKYDSSWDLDFGEDGYDEDAFDRKYEEWEGRDWVEWLKAKLTFPFQVERMEDMYMDRIPSHRNPFPVGCRVTVTGISDCDFEPDFHGVLVDAVGGKKKKGVLPLQDIEVYPESDSNYWPVREFAVWYANR